MELTYSYAHFTLKCAVCSSAHTRIDLDLEWHLVTNVTYVLIIFDDGPTIHI